MNYTADINILEPADIQVFDKCVAWREKTHQDKQYKEEYDNMKTKFIQESESLIEDLDKSSEGGEVPERRYATVVDMIPGFAKDLIPIPTSNKNQPPSTPTQNQAKLELNSSF